MLGENQRASGPLPLLSPSVPPSVLPAAAAYVDVGKNMVKWTSESESEGGGGMAGGKLGVNSIDIMNFGHETGPSSGPYSVQGRSKFRYVSKLQT